MRRISLLLTTTLAIVNGLRVLPSNSIIKNNNLKYYSSTILQSTEEKKDTGHLSNMEVPKMTQEEELLIGKFREHQSKAARLTMAQEVRTLIDQSIGYGVLSTNSNDIPGFPTGSVVGFELDDEGYPFFVFSSMSAHTKDVLKDGKVSLTVMANDFKGAAEGRVVLIGNVIKLFDNDKKTVLREKYLKKHKDAYWIDFGDFMYFTMTSIQAIRYIGGFAMAGGVTPTDYLNSKPDPIAPFATPVLKHMNEDHADSTIAMIKHYVGLTCTEAQITSMDSLGMTVKAKLEIAGGGYTKIRLPFLKPVTERKAVKEMLVEMTKASQS